MNIKWTEPAEMDLGDIYAYIAEEAPVQAEQVVDRITEKVSLLQEQPRMGRLAPEAGRDDIRELTVYSYRIFYLETQNCIYIIGIIHGRRNITKMKHKPWDL